MEALRWAPRLAQGLWALLVAALLLTGATDRLTYWGYHLLFAWRGPLPDPGRVAIVALDEPSLEALGRWPLPRRVHASVVDALLNAGARTVGVDVTFPQAQDPGDDAALRRVLAAHPDRVVLAGTLEPAPHGQGEALSLPYEPFRAAAATGLVNFDFDADGAIHALTPFREAVDPADPRRLAPFPSFDWALARRLGAPLAEPPPPRLGIRFLGPPGTFETVPFVMVAEAAERGDAAFLSRFAGKAVLVGATSLRLQDQYPTPFADAGVFGTAERYMPGVEIHANALQTLLDGRPVRGFPRWAGLAGLLLWCALAAIMLRRLKPVRGGLALLAALAGLALASLACFSAWERHLDFTVPALAGVGVYVISAASHFVRAEGARRRIRRTFERYVSPEIVEAILRHPDAAPALGGEERVVSVLFSDIRAFTTLSERLSPSAVVAFLNAYLTEMAEVILAESGCIDKYIGDAILAVWGNVVPMTPEEAAAGAVRAGLAMQARVARKREEWRERGFPEVAIGVGVNTGPAIVGNIGSPRKMEFGVIGDAINVASRLEGLTKDYGGALLVSGATWALLGGRFEGEALGEVRVKGREAPVSLYAVRAEKA